MKEEDINIECRQIWEELGPWWDASVEDGDFFHKVFVFPTIDKFLNIQGNEDVLDAGCGNGALTRRIAKMGANVSGVDFSSSLIKQARLRSPNISYQEIDLTSKEQLSQLAQTQIYDRIVCSMVLHDMSTVDPFFESLRLLLKPKGSFIFSIPHPHFNSPYVSLGHSDFLAVTDYIQSNTFRLRSKPDQPIDQLVFHRPMTYYFNLMIAQGMVMTGFEEPCIDSKLLPENSLWKKYPGIPPTLISRWTFLES